MSTRHLPALTLVAAALVVATALATSSSGANAGASSAWRTIASSTTNDFRVVVSARKIGGGAAPAAEARVRSFERVRGRWVASGSSKLFGGYFWKTLTGPRAVCRLEIRTAGPGAGFRARAVVQLLQTPSLGCGPATPHDLT